MAITGISSVNCFDQYLTYDICAIWNNSYKLKYFLKVSLFHGYFSRFLNCTDGTYHIVQSISYIHISEIYEGIEMHGVDAMFKLTL